jgi:acyl-CoA thioester hydrolase
MAEAADERRESYPYRLAVPSRWEDGDMLRHINNVVFYQYFQQAFVTFLNQAGLDWFTDQVIPYAAESSCRLLRPLSFPDVIDVGMRVSRLGNSSVTYDFALFRQGDEPPAAVGRFVHVFVDRDSHRPSPIPAAIRAAYERIAAPSA